MIYKILLKFLISLAMLVAFGKVSNAIDLDRVYISEVGWAGTKASYSDEWLELYNPQSFAVDLSGWIIKEDSLELIALSGVVKARSYYLVERGSDNVISNIPASEQPVKWQKSLINTGAKLELIDASGEIIDVVDCSKKWCKGDATARKSMERSFDLGSWYSGSESAIAKDKAGNKIYGSPLSKNVLAGLLANSFNISENSSNQILIKEADPEIIVTSIKYAGMYELSLQLAVDNISNTRIYKVKFSPDIFVLSDDKNRWIYSSEPWNKFPAIYQEKAFKLRLANLDSRILRIQVRDSLTLLTVEKTIDLPLSPFIPKLSESSSSTATPNPAFYPLEAKMSEVLGIAQLEASASSNIKSSTQDGSRNNLLYMLVAGVVFTFLLLIGLIGLKKIKFLNKSP